MPLWPAILGALIGLPLIVLACVWYARRWTTFTPRKRWLYGAAIALIETAYWLNVYAWFIEPNRLVVREYEIVSADWHGAPLTIAAIADTHVGGPHVSAERIEKIVRRINRLNPDLVVLLGDYVGGHAPLAEHDGASQFEIANGIAAFAALNAPLGAVAVLGNHDSWYDRTAITLALQEAGVATLWNRNVEISRPGGGFVVAGLADLDTGEPDFAAALDGAPPEDTLMLSHNPDVFPLMPRGPALMLAAHTHCGQVSLLFLGRPITPSRFGQRFACGRVEENGRVMVVTGGVGTSVAPLRFLNPPEIVLIRLRAVRSH